MSQLFTKYWSFSFNVSPSSEPPGLISFRMDWLDLLAVQGTLKSLLQHDSSKVSILQSSAFFIVQLSHPYMTTGKTIALTRWTFVGKIMSLLFNMLSRSREAQLTNSSSVLVEHQDLHTYTHRAERCRAGQECADNTQRVCSMKAGPQLTLLNPSPGHAWPTKHLWS